MEWTGADVAGMASDLTERLLDSLRADKSASTSGAQAISAVERTAAAQKLWELCESDEPQQISHLVLQGGAFVLGTACLEDTDERTRQFTAFALLSVLSGASSAHRPALRLQLSESGDPPLLWRILRRLSGGGERNQSVETILVDVLCALISRDVAPYYELDPAELPGLIRLGLDRVERPAVVGGPRGWMAGWLRGATRTIPPPSATGRLLRVGYLKLLCLVLGLAGRNSNLELEVADDVHEARAVWASSVAAAFVGNGGAEVILAFLGRQGPEITSLQSGGVKDDVDLEAPALSIRALRLLIDSPSPPVPAEEASILVFSDIKALLFVLKLLIGLRYSYSAPGTPKRRGGHHDATRNNLIIECAILLCTGCALSSACRAALRRTLRELDIVDSSALTRELRSNVLHVLVQPQLMDELSNLRLGFPGSSHLETIGKKASVLETAFLLAMDGESDALGAQLAMLTLQDYAQEYISSEELGQSNNRPSAGRRALPAFTRVENVEKSAAQRGNPLREGSLDLSCRISSSLTSPVGCVHEIEEIPTRSTPGSLFQHRNRISPERPTWQHPGEEFHASEDGTWHFHVDLGACSSKYLSHITIFANTAVRATKKKMLTTPAQDCKYGERYASISKVHVRAAATVQCVKHLHFYSRVLGHRSLRKQLLKLVLNRYRSSILTDSNIALCTLDIAKGNQTVSGFLQRMFNGTVGFENVSLQLSECFVRWSMLVTERGWRTDDFEKAMNFRAICIQRKCYRSLCSSRVRRRCELETECELAKSRDNFTKHTAWNRWALAAKRGKEDFHNQMDVLDSCDVAKNRTESLTGTKKHGGAERAHVYVGSSDPSGYQPEGDAVLQDRRLEKSRFDSIICAHVSTIDTIATKKLALSSTKHTSENPIAYEEEQRRIKAAVFPSTHVPEKLSFGSNDSEVEDSEDNDSNVDDGGDISTSVDVALISEHPGLVPHAPECAEGKNDSELSKFQNVGTKRRRQDSALELYVWTLRCMAFSGWWRLCLLRRKELTISCKEKLAEDELRLYEDARQAAATDAQHIKELKVLDPEIWETEADQLAEYWKSTRQHFIELFFPMEFGLRWIFGRWRAQVGLERRTRAAAAMAIERWKLSSQQAVFATFRWVTAIERKVRSLSAAFAGRETGQWLRRCLTAWIEFREYRMIKHASRVRAMSFRADVILRGAWMAWGAFIFLSRTHHAKEKAAQSVGQAKIKLKAFLQWKSTVLFLSRVRRLITELQGKQNETMQRMALQILLSHTQRALRARRVSALALEFCERMCSARIMRAWFQTYLYRANVRTMATSADLFFVTLKRKRCFYVWKSVRDLSAVHDPVADLFHKIVLKRRVLRSFTFIVRDTNDRIHGRFQGIPRSIILRAKHLASGGSTTDRSAQDTRVAYLSSWGAWLGAKFAHHPPSAQTVFHKRETHLTTKKVSGGTIFASAASPRRTHPRLAPRQLESEMLHD